MPTPFHVVLNPGSGRQDRDARLALIRSTLEAAGRTFELAVVKRPGELTAVGRRMLARAQETGGALVAAGGDGTINTLAGLALRADVPFGILPGGTFNYVARAHGIPTDTEAALQALLQARERPVAVGMVNDRPFLVNASMGMYAQSLDDREVFKQRLGRSRPVALLAAVFTALQRHRHWVITLEADGQETTVVTSTLFVGNNHLQLAQLGFVETDAPPSDTLLAVVTAPLSRPAILGLMLRGAIGRLAEADGVRCLPFQRLTVSPKLLHKPRRLKVATDGETAWLTTPLRFQHAPQRLRLLVPA
ncbi:diacylglycerol kinase [Aquabacterium fontiphilum]|jgi:diacylglycerol kinase family enzyme|uniref:diacylglycerol/lipid kinase family protein n=1 Tax=Aquabacterium fontiphilum TaxID=450365 RepID=UPI0013783E92|nr:diacylglycerol kinase family protein [Aquabacterium fontiphilum]NBD19429.1 diacylglycerol kinase [Aquabacterium fontiphilum]